MDLLDRVQRLSIHFYCSTPNTGSVGGTFVGRRHKEKCGLSSTDTLCGISSFSESAEDLTRASGQAYPTATPLLTIRADGSDPPLLPFPWHNECMLLLLRAGTSQVADWRAHI